MATEEVRYELSKDFLTWLAEARPGAHAVLIEHGIQHGLLLHRQPRSRLRFPHLGFAQLRGGRGAEFDIAIDCEGALLILDGHPDSLLNDRPPPGAGPLNLARVGDNVGVNEVLLMAKLASMLTNRRGLAAVVGRDAFTVRLRLRGGVEVTLDVDEMAAANNPLAWTETG